MDLRITEPTLSLRTGELLTLQDAAGHRVVARTGTVWVTEEDSVDDHIVAAGESLVLSRPGRTVIQALDPAWVSIR